MASINESNADNHLADPKPWLANTSPLPVARHNESAHLDTIQVPSLLLQISTASDTSSSWSSDNLDTPSATEEQVNFPSGSRDEYSGGESPESDCPQENIPGGTIPTEEKLEANLIFVNQKRPLPDHLAEFVRTVIKKPRPGPASPNSKIISDQQRLAQMQSEVDAIQILEQYLMFRGNVQPGAAVATWHHIYSKNNRILSKDYLPPPPKNYHHGLHGRLEGAVPDTACVYVQRKEVLSGDEKEMPFTRAEEECAKTCFPLTVYAIFIWLTSQWKGRNGNQNLADARFQAARDGAVICNHWHHLFSSAFPGIDPTPTETFHFSVTCDIESVEIWMHWNDNDRHHMEMLHSSPMEEHPTYGMQPLEDTRSILHNIREDAVGRRRDMIKEALGRLIARKEDGSRPSKRHKTRGDSSGVLEGAE